MRIAVVQMNSGDNKAANLRQAELFIQKAAKKGCDLVSFSENFLMMAATHQDLLKAAENRRSSPSLRTLHHLAHKLKIWIHAGSVPIKTSNPNKVWNMSVLMGPKKSQLWHYQKIHLFDSSVLGDREYRESHHVEAGRKIVCAPSPWGKLGLSICYDLRFPELYRKLICQDVKIIFIPAAFTVPTGQAHWDVLTRARAIENQCFVICAAQWGSHPGGRKTYGHSRIIDPWGNVIIEKEKGEGMIVADLDFKEQRAVRNRLPCLEHRVL